MFCHPLAERHRRAKESTIVAGLLLAVTSFYLSTQASWLPQPMMPLEQLVAPTVILALLSLILAVVFEHEDRRTRPVEVCVFRHAVRFGNHELAHDEPLDLLSSSLLTLELRGFKGNQRALQACLDGVRQRATFTEPKGGYEDHVHRLRHRSG